MSTQERKALSCFRVYFLILIISRGEEGVRGKGKLRGYAGLTQVVRARCKRLGVFLTRPLFGAVVVSEWGVAL